MSNRVAKSHVDQPAQLQISAKVGIAHVPFLRTRLRKALRLFDTKLQSVSLALVGDGLMSKLHVQFMNIAGPTDVLTFELEHDARGRVIGGEVVVCVPEARRQARAHDTRIERELLLYAIHGLLHLSGYDDRTDSDFQAIHLEEDRILTALGVGPVFRPADVLPKRRKSAQTSGRKKDGRSR